jgi:NADH-ubiquinone oxidoreductase chain 5
MSICFVRLDFFISLGLVLLLWGLCFITFYLVYFTDWNIIKLNGISIIMTFLFDLMSLLFIGFGFNIYS